MDGDVVCECPLPTVLSPCANAVWPSQLLSQSPGRKRRSLRPHSSPVRNSQGKHDNIQGLSSPGIVIPSAPSQAFLQPPSELFTPPPSPGRSIGGCSIVPPYGAPEALVSNKAYFSSRPPPKPLVLVPVSIPSSLAVLFASNKTAEKEPPDHNEKMARTLLQEVVGALPLSGPRAASSTHSSRSPRSPRTHRSPRSPRHFRRAPTYKHSRLSSESSVGGNTNIKCHVATQAHTNESVGSCASVNGSADEWLGGVRALRDSHVRLVLRQLRHIDRLNRALDRVRCVPVIKTNCTDDLAA